ncbi:MAG: hypothetical protein QOJ92_2142 [Frankiales bacterium]|nr:hypothetical protein [Frankiales bacterium]
MSRPPSQKVAAEEVVIAVETYSDRLHDLLRRRGLGTADAAAVVTASAEELVEVAATESLQDPLGWWWARALSMGDRKRSVAAPRVRDSDPVDNALGRLAPPLQLAVLLRDDYDLPLPSVAVALGVGRSLAADRVLQGRLQLVAEHDGQPAHGLSGHDTREALDPASLLGVADGVLPPAETARMRRHLHTCTACEAVVTDAQRGRRLAAALPVEALADEPRDALLQRVRERSAELLPALSELMSAQEEEAAEASSRPLVPLPVVLVALAAALVLGAITGAVTAPPDQRASAAPDDVPSGEPGATLTATPTPTPTPTATATPRTRQTSAPPRTATAVPTTAPPVVAGPPRISINPTSGPNNQSVTVSGAGWEPGTSVTVDYVNFLGQSMGSSFGSVGSNGRFVTTLVCSDPVPGRHTIRASDGVSTATQPYNEQ